MKLKGKSLHMNKAQVFRWVLSVRRGIQGLPRWLLILHGHALDFITVLVVLALSAAMFIHLTFFDPPAIGAIQDTETELETTGIDELELWIEERGSAAEDPVDIPPGIEFGAPATR